MRLGRLLGRGTLRDRPLPGPAEVPMTRVFTDTIENGSFSVPTLEEEARYRAEVREREEKLAAMDAAGEALLRRVLEPCQYEDWESNKWFSVRAADGLLYRYNGARLTNQVSRDGFVWCAVVPGASCISPGHAAAIALCLMNKASYARFMAVAIRGHAFNVEPTDYDGKI